MSSSVVPTRNDKRKRPTTERVQASPSTPRPTKAACVAPDIKKCRRQAGSKQRRPVRVAPCIPFMGESSEEDIAVSLWRFKAEFDTIDAVEMRQPVRRSAPRLATERSVARLTGMCQSGEQSAALARIQLP